MTAIRGTVVWGQLTKWSSNETPMYTQQPSFKAQNLVSVNKPLIYQVWWNAPAAEGYAEVNEMYVPCCALADGKGDVVSVIFKVYATTEFPTPALSADWDLISSIRKTRDIPNTNIVNGTIAVGQRFTVDVSQIAADQLSYSLVPIGKGSWETQTYGGMNGGNQKQDNITEDISPYNVTRNGSYRAIRVRAEIEMINANGEVELSSTTVSSAPYVRVINSVPDFNRNTYYNRMRVLSQNGVTTSSPKRALTNCPNYTPQSTGTYSTPSYMKPTRLSEKAEFLYFYVAETFNTADPTDYYNRYEVLGVTYTADNVQQNAFVLGSEWKNQNGLTEITSDISHTFEKETATAFAHVQNQMCVQNVSAGYINDHAYYDGEGDYPYNGANTGKYSPITASTAYYKLYVRGFYNANNPAPNDWVPVRHSSVYWFKIDREDDNVPYGAVRFHWLNTVGGIDSYTARRDVLESMSINKSTMEKALPNRLYFQDNENSSGTVFPAGSYYNDSMRGWNTYQGGTEVLNVEANINNKVYTEPLNKIEADWLKEIFQSPNVWIEQETDNSDGINYESDAAYHMNQLNPTLRPIKTIYKPVIITNSEVVSLDQSKGLVMFNIEYTFSQGVLTQRN